MSAVAPADLVDGLEQLQRIANLVTAAEQRLLAHAIDTDVLEPFGAARPQDLLIDRLHLRRAEANSRVRRAERVGAFTTLTGEPVPPKLPQLAAAQAGGALSGDHVDVITHHGQDRTVRHSRPAP